MRKTIFAGALVCTFSLMTPFAVADDLATTDSVSTDSVTTDAVAKEEAPEVRAGKEVFETFCMACHPVEGKAVIAPPIFAVKSHVLESYPEREGFVERVVNWVKAPDADNPLMPGAIRKFGLMPAMLAIPDAELTAVAEFLYDSDMAFPDWYVEHYKEEHGEAPKQAAPSKKE